jgi:hypothetical protein
LSSITAGAKINGLGDILTMVAHRQLAGTVMALAATPLAREIGYPCSATLFDAHR